MKGLYGTGRHADWLLTFFQPIKAQVAELRSAILTELGYTIRAGFETLVASLAFTFIYLYDASGSIFAEGTAGTSIYTGRCGTMPARRMGK